MGLVYILGLNFLFGIYYFFTGYIHSVFISIDLAFILVLIFDFIFKHFKIRRSLHHIENKNFQFTRLIGGIIILFGMVHIYFWTVFFGMVFNGSNNSGKGRLPFWEKVNCGIDKFAWPSIAGDNEGNVYVSNSENGFISSYDKTGSFRYSILVVGMKGSCPIYIDKDGNVYAERYNLYKFNKNGRFVKQWLRPPWTPSSPDTFFKFNNADDIKVITNAINVKYTASTLSPNQILAPSHDGVEYFETPNYFYMLGNASKDVGLHFFNTFTPQIIIQDKKSNHIIKILPPVLTRYLYFPFLLSFIFYTGVFDIIIFIFGKFFKKSNDG